MVELKQSPLAGCFEVQFKLFEDDRGRFVKVFHSETFKKIGLQTDFKEEYFSVSKKGVVRGLHFQTPPHDHDKFVYCTDGSVVDVVLDLRKDSSTFGKWADFHLDASKANGVYIPKGMAHGFCVTSDSATLVYKVSTVYAPKNDEGLLWNSIGYEWPIASPIISSRDASFKKLADFETPFK